MATWSARQAVVTFHGKSVHPGTAKGVMVNAVYALADFLSRMPRDMLPETTEGRVGFVHPYSGIADVEQSSIKVLLRDFEMSGLDAKERLIRDLAAATKASFPGVTVGVAWHFTQQMLPEVVPAERFPRLAAFSAAVEALPEFAAAPHGDGEYRGPLAEPS